MEASVGAPKTVSPAIACGAPNFAIPGAILFGSTSTSLSEESISIRSNCHAKRVSGEAGQSCGGQTRQCSAMDTYSRHLTPCAFPYCGSPGRFLPASYAVRMDRTG